MNALTENVQIIHDSRGVPEFAVIPFANYRAMVSGKTKVEHHVPHDVVSIAMNKECSSAKAWREYLGLTQAEVAKRIGVSQSAYAQLEAKKSLRKSSREKISNALGIDQSQLDF